tara:strand:+ start:103 stop:213 length:111 start_codon:yes stop_codon:yes gene_type:complete
MNLLDDRIQFVGRCENTEESDEKKNTSATKALHEIQ